MFALIFMLVHALFVGAHSRTPSLSKRISLRFQSGSKSCSLTLLQFSVKSIYAKSPTMENTHFIVELINILLLWFAES